jgi:predicted nucleotidyltransferase
LITRVKEPRVTEVFAGLIDRLAARGLLPDEYLAVLLVGSAARGWDNSGSDYDFYIMTSESWRTDTCQAVALPLDPPTVWIDTVYDEGRRWELRYWLDSQVDQVFAKVSWAEFERDRIERQVLSVPEELLLARLTDGVLLAGKEWLAERRAQLDASAFRSLIVARSLAAADDSVEDALGQLNAGQVHSAVLAAKKALGHTVDALLEQHGEYGSHMSKWRPQRFRAARPAALSFQEYWELETMRTFDPQDPARWVNEVLTICQDISIKVAI